jgi:hypothetical protein
VARDCSGGRLSGWVKWVCVTTGTRCRRLVYIWSSEGRLGVFHRGFDEAFDDDAVFLCRWWCSPVVPVCGGIRLQKAPKADGFEN